MKKLISIAAFMTAALSAPAMAADMGRPVYKAAPATAVYNWTSFYAGANIGYGWSDDSSGLAPASPGTGGGNSILAAMQAGVIPTGLHSNSKGVVGGLQAGYNFQVDRFVYGVEADFSGSSVSGTGSFAAAANAPFMGFNTSQHRQLDWFGTLRARAGVAIADPLLLYATGGLAYGKVQASTSVLESDCPPISASAFCAVGGPSQVKVGWAAGGGAEYAFAPRWTMKVEYLYLDLGKSDYTIVRPATPNWDYATSAKFQEHIVRFGVNYQFGGPVVARY